jgi:hypothetical protein
MAQVLDSMDVTSTQIEDAIFHVEKICGPLANLALDDKVDEVLQQRLDRLDESVAHLQGDIASIVRDMLPTMECILENTSDIVTRLAVPVEPAFQDCWVCKFSSVPSPPAYVVETQYVRKLRKALLDETGQRRVFTLHGWGDAGKTTACKVIANDDGVRQRVQHGIIWVEFGEEALSGALIERFVA